MRKKQINKKNPKVSTKAVKKNPSIVGMKELRKQYSNLPPKKVMFTIQTLCRELKITRPTATKLLKNIQDNNSLNIHPQSVGEKKKWYSLKY